MNSKTYYFSPKGPWIIITIAFLLVAVFLFFGRHFFKAAEKATLEEFNQRQLVLAKGVTSGTELYFQAISNDLRALGKLPEIQDFDETLSKRHLYHTFDSLKTLGANDIGILDSEGKLRYNATAPQIEGKDFSWRKYFQEARSMSDSSHYVIEFIEFKGAEAGQKGILVAVPMFKTLGFKDYSQSRNKFAGVVLCTLKLDTITSKFIAPVKATERGHALLIDNEYNILWSPDVSLFGKSLLEESAGFRAFHKVVKNMGTGRSDTTDYSFFVYDDSIGKYSEDKEEYLIAYTPVNIGNKFWSIAVIAPKRDAQKLIFSVYRRYQLLIGSIILIILIGASYALTTSSRISIALEKEVDNKTSKLRASRNRLEAVRNIGALANSTLNLNKVLHLILKGTMEVSGVSIGIIFLKDPKTGYLMWGASIGLPKNFVNGYKERHIRPGEGLSGSIAQSGNYIYIPEDVSHDPRISHPLSGAEALNSFIGVPIYAGDEIVGVMNILTRTPDILSEDDITLAVAIGSHVGSAIRNAQLFERLTQTMEAFRENENKYRTLLENLPQKIFFKDRNSVYISCNEHYAQSLNIKPNEIIGKTDHDFHPKELAEKYRADDKRIIESGEIEDIEEEYVQNGQKTYVQTVKTSVKDDGGNVIGILGIFWDITERKSTEEKIKESLREKEVLLKEIHHRVKNNMQVISSLLNIQSQYLKDEKYINLFNESKNRITSMALVHEKLYRSDDLTNIAFDDYIYSLANGLFSFYKVNTEDISLCVDAKDHTLGIDLAIPCGLIINELISNSLKHAFPDSRSGEIKITFRETDKEKGKEYELIVSDDGVGLPDDLDIRGTKTFGLQLVTNLTEHQLQGKLKLYRDNGTIFHIRFKELMYKKRI